jgi:hypothetical protein
VEFSCFLLLADHFAVQFMLLLGQPGNPNRDDKLKRANTLRQLAGLICGCFPILTCLVNQS